MTSGAVLNLVSALALFGGLVFTGLQIRASQQQRSRETMFQLLQSFRTREFVEGMTVFADLPDGLSRAELEARLGDKLLPVRMVLFALESIGSLVQKREIPIDLVEEYFRGPVLLAWRKTEHYMRDLRADIGSPRVYEYVQWLAERIAERNADGREPAYIAYRDWKA
jgi:hypothetical protein